jgi:hypothetical protein
LFGLFVISRIEALSNPPEYRSVLHVSYAKIRLLLEVFFLGGGGYVRALSAVTITILFTEMIGVNFQIGTKLINALAVGDMQVLIKPQKQTVHVITPVKWGVKWPTNFDSLNTAMSDRNPAYECAHCARARVVDDLRLAAVVGLRRKLYVSPYKYFSLVPQFLARRRRKRRRKRRMMMMIIITITINKGDPSKNRRDWDHFKVI